MKGLGRAAPDARGGSKPAPARRAPRPAVLDPRHQLDLKPDQSLELLQALHILTPDGRINQDSRRKLKQVQHLLRFIEERLQPYPDAQPLSLADHGAGKSYLGFLVYDLLLRHRDQAWVYGVEARTDLVEASRQLAQRLGFERMRFIAAEVAQTVGAPQLPAHVDMVTALHACDTATDDAIAFALQHQAQHIILVPCCQAEVARQLNQHKALLLSRTPLAELWRHPLHTRELGSQITNVLRCLYLEACGYSVTVTELVGWEHSMKNELILARRTGHPRPSARQRLLDILDTFGLQALLASRFAQLQA